ncbi:uncharacterized protein LOC101708968 [Heterocephalus glaber]|uniref:Uncharacterized protein LOC101708968 n=1 Tax=Heterocephalus glaber TaxID=10181 RepID=A0AAX6P2J2_HETGA|nr:uncharacterized protein LOC101708968 [Heterocephalus glaber]
MRRGARGARARSLPRRLPPPLPVGMPAPGARSLEAAGSAGRPRRASPCARGPPELGLAGVRLRAAASAPRPRSPARQCGVREAGDWWSATAAGAWSSGRGGASRGWAAQPGTSGPVPQDGRGARFGSEWEFSASGPAGPRQRDALRPRLRRGSQEARTSRPWEPSVPQLPAMALDPASQQTTGGRAPLRFRLWKSGFLGGLSCPLLK